MTLSAEGDSAGNSRAIDTNQCGLHERLVEIVKKHQRTSYRAPISEHAARAWAELKAFRAAQLTPIVLDSGCGTGDSTRQLARMYPHCCVIGIDRSLSRLSRVRPEGAGNMLLLRANLEEIFRLAALEGIEVERHFILYPNPYPKSQHLKRRWHGSPVFSDLVALGGDLVLRSNWKIYLQEFATALSIFGYKASIEVYDPSDQYLTLFERKYHKSGQQLWQLRASLSKGDGGRPPIEP